MGNVNQWDVIRVANRFESTFSDVQMNIFHLTYGGATPVTDQEFMDDAATYLTTLWGILKARTSNKLRWKGAEFYNETQDVYMGGRGADEPGSATLDTSPPQCTLFTTMRTTTKKTVGKKFPPGFTEEHQVAGKWTATSVEILLDWVTEWMSGFIVGLLPEQWVLPVVWKRVLGVAAWIFSVVANTEIGSQRRRRTLL